MLNQQQTEQAIAELRAAYVAFNRGDIDAAVRPLDPQVEWVEPVEFPNGAAYHGIEGAKRYLAQSRAAAARVISEPEQFIPAGDRIVVFVHARVLPKDGDNWEDITLADVYTFQDRKVTKMRAFRTERKRCNGSAFKTPTHDCCSNTTFISDRSVGNATEHPIREAL